MNRKEIINHRQMAWVVGAIFAASGFVNQQSELIHISGPDAWGSYMLPILYAFGVCFVFYYLIQLYPGKNLFQISFELCGKWVGGIVNLLFLIHLWLN
ncbi:MAG: hypothetical protein K0R75_1289, partial [Paenibacillaceae bacterium]|nr:hypothetical protein [Paenibacillaceae bacterium]